MLPPNEVQAYRALRDASTMMYAHATYVADVWDALGDPTHYFWRNMDDDTLLAEFELVLKDMAQEQHFFEDALARLTEALEDLGNVYANS